MDELSNHMSKLRVLLIQLPVPNNPATNVPLAAGYLKAHAQARGLLDRVEIDILPRALADHAGDALLVKAIVARRPELLGISLYTWNSERSLAIAARVKAQLPGLLVVVGGPEVQRDNDWVLRHPAVDVAVIGEGEQTFCEMLQIVNCKLQIEPANRQFAIYNLQSVPGLAYRDANGDLTFTPERVALSDLALLPSPYLLGYLEPGQILMVEISRWCPYSCGFCLYGRNMGPKLGSRYFPLDRILAEIRWGREHGATQIHFIEANLNLVPVFWPLMRALEDLNAASTPFDPAQGNRSGQSDHALTLYAELRGEHLTDESVAALARAGLRVAEVGLQTANLAALKAAHRKTDLQKWAAGTRRLAQQGVEIYLDVILGLPADDAAGVATTLDFIQRENLGPYDIFTLQVLAGTETRRQAAEYGLVHQDRPPYYVLETDRLSYDDLRRLRRELKHGAGLDPDEIEGCPPPRLSALTTTDGRPPTIIATTSSNRPIHKLWLENADSADWQALESVVSQLATHVDIVINWDQAQPSQAVGRRSPALSSVQGSVACPEQCRRVSRLTSLLDQAMIENPSTLFDYYLLADMPPQPGALRDWRAALPYTPGYLDRVAVYRRTEPQPDHVRVSPRLWLVLPWTAQVDPEEYAGVAEIIWKYNLAADEMPPFGAWAAAGGAGVWLHFPPGCAPGPQAEVMATMRQWQRETGRRVWGGTDE